MGPKKARSNSGRGLYNAGGESRTGESDPGSGRLRSSRHFSPSVPQLRTQDLTYFREMPRAQGYLARIRPVQPTHRGTFSCVITHDQRALARLYFFLNGAGGTMRGAGPHEGRGRARLTCASAQ